MAGSPTNPDDRGRAGEKPTQRKLLQADRSVDPEAKKPVTLRECFDGPFADDVADKGLRLALADLLSRGHDEDSIMAANAEALDYWLGKSECPIAPIAWPSLIYDKTRYELFDAFRRARDLPPGPDPIGDLIDFLRADGQPLPIGIAQANEANDLTHEILARRYPAPFDDLIAGLDIMSEYVDMCQSPELSRRARCKELCESICTCCGEGNAALQRAARTWPEVCAVFRVEDPYFAEQGDFDDMLRCFVAVRRLIAGKQDPRLETAYWLMEWGWERAEALQISGLEDSDKWRKAVNRFHKYVTDYAQSVTLAKAPESPATCPLSAHIPPLRHTSVA